MNKKDIENLKSGSELDELVAEKVMGWKRCISPLQSRDDPEPKGWDTGKGSGWATRNNTPKFSSDIACSWSIMRRFGAWDISKRRNGEVGYYVKLFDGEKWLQEGDGELSGDTTISLAICHAALKAALLK